jgi:hypothetical protein
MAIVGNHPPHAPARRGSLVSPVSRMSEEAVRQVIGLLFDPAFKAEFDADPRAALAKRNLELTDEEIDRLRPQKKPEGMRSEALDDRIKRRTDSLGF